MNSASLLSYLKKVEGMTATTEQLLKKFREPKSLIYGAIWSLRKKGYEIICPEMGVYQLLKVEKGDSPFTGHRESPVLKKSNSVISKNLNSAVPKKLESVVPRNVTFEEDLFCKRVPVLPEGDQEDYLKLMKQSVYYGLCAEALVKANEFQKSLRERMIHG